MIICMSDIVCITNRKLCEGKFIEQMTRIAAGHPDSIVLREKDLSEDDYFALAMRLQTVCQEYGVPLTLHSFYQAARELGVGRVHLPLSVLREMSAEDKAFFPVIGVSCHSTADAVEAQQLGAAYITAGHIFETDCKAGLPGRGLDFLRRVKSCVTIPVYAIGGISPDNAKEVIHAGADGICIMSGFMKSQDPSGLMAALRR